MRLIGSRKIQPCVPPPAPPPPYWLNFYGALELGDIYSCMPNLNFLTSYLNSFRRRQGFQKREPDTKLGVMLRGVVFPTTVFNRRPMTQRLTKWPTNQRSCQSQDRLAHINRCLLWTPAQRSLSEVHYILPMFFYIFMAALFSGPGWRRFAKLLHVVDLGRNYRSY